MENSIRTRAPRSKPWSCLPSVVLYSVLQLLSAVDKLSASSVCKQWREVFNLSRPLLWEYLSISCKSRQRRSKLKIFFHLDMCVKFSPFCRTLVVKWCPCQITFLIALFQRLKESSIVFTKLKGISLKQNHPKECSKTCASSKEGLESEFLAVFDSFLRSFNSLKNLSFGYGCGSRMFQMICKLRTDNDLKLTSLNVASLKYTPNTFTACTCSLLQSISEVTINAEFITEAILKNLLQFEAINLNVLKIVVRDSAEFNFPEYETWAAVGKRFPNLSVHLIVIAVDHRSTDLPEEMYHRSIPVKHIVIVYRLLKECHFPRFSTLISSHEHLESLSVHGIESKKVALHGTEQGQRWLEAVHLKRQHLQRFTLTGFNVPMDEIPAQVVSCACAKLKELQISKFEILKEATAVDFLISLSQDRKTLNRFEKYMSEKLGWTWQAHPELPLQRILKQKHVALLDIALQILQKLEDI